MGDIDRDLTRRLLQDAERLRGRAKGQALEQALTHIFDAVPGLELVARDMKDAAGAEELDLGYLNDGRSLRWFGSEVLVECKNWDEPVGAPQVGWFIHKLRSAQQQAGILVAAHGVTGNPQKRSAALHEINMARAAFPPVNVVVLTREEIELLVDSQSVARLLHQKLFHVRTRGEVFQANEAELSRGRGQMTATEQVQVAARTAAIPSDGPMRTFNATPLSPHDLAGRLVPHLALRQLARAGNSLLIGPRGSGKTALLRSLTAVTSDAVDPNFSEVLGISYSGIYLSTRRMVTTVDESEAFGDVALLNAASFTAEALAAFVDTVIYRLGTIPSDCKRRNVEERLTTTIADAQGLTLATASLPELVHALRERSRQWSRSARLGGSTGDAYSSEALRQRPILADLYYAIAYAIDASNAFLEEPDHQWCLLVDDLDSCDPALAQTLLSLMRSGGEELLVKVAAGPSAAEQWIRSSNSAVAGQDYDVVALPSGDSFEWSKEVMLADLERWHGRVLSLDDFLGPSQLPVPTGDGRSEIEQGLQLVRRLAARDASFQDWASKHGLLQNQLNGQQSALMRRIVWVASIRDQYLANDGRRVLTRRTLRLWTGYPIVVRLFADQPRLLLAFLSELQDRVGPSGRATADLQGKALSHVLERYTASIQMATGGVVLRMLDRIGRSLEARVLGPFTPDVPGAFVVDQNMAKTDRDAVAIAMELGAVLPVESAHNVGMWGLDNAPLRLASFLAPRYRLPLRQGRTVALSSLLKGVSRAQSSS